MSVEILDLIAEVAASADHENTSKMLMNSNDSNILNISQYIVGANEYTNIENNIDIENINIFKYIDGGDSTNTDTLNNINITDFIDNSADSNTLNIDNSANTPDTDTPNNILLPKLNELIMPTLANEKNTNSSIYGSSEPSGDSSKSSESTNSIENTNSIESTNSIISGGSIMSGDVSGKIPDIVNEECSLSKVVESPTCEVCMSNDSLNIVKEKIEEQTNKKLPDNPVEIVEIAKNVLNAKNEREVVKEIVAAVNPTLAKKEISQNFKRIGPTDVSLLNNFDIDGTLQQWKNTLFPTAFMYDFNMADYEKTSGSLATVNVADLYKQGIRCVACVINSDVSSGGGKHWMALFGDFRSIPSKDGPNATPWTIEFFNSSGQAPELPWKMWMHKTAQQMQEIANGEGISSIEEIRVSKKCHQKSRTECGVYSLYYIWSRLNGTPWADFCDKRISDELMFEFRQHLFYDPKRPPVRQFNYEQYKKETNIKWE